MKTTAPPANRERRKGPETFVGGCTRPLWENLARRLEADAFALTLITQASRDDKTQDDKAAMRSAPKRRLSDLSGKQPGDTRNT